MNVAPTAAEKSRSKNLSVVMETKESEELYLYNVSGYKQNWNASLSLLDLSRKDKYRIQTTTMFAYNDKYWT